MQSRLDYWLTSKHLDFSIVKTEISPGRRSDHSVVSLTIELQNRATGERILEIEYKLITRRRLPKSNKETH